MFRIYLLIFLKIVFSICSVDLLTLRSNIVERYIELLWAVCCHRSVLRRRHFQRYTKVFFFFCFMGNDVHLLQSTTSIPSATDNQLVEYFFDNIIKRQHNNNNFVACKSIIKYLYRFNNNKKTGVLRL